MEERHSWRETSEDRHIPTVRKKHRHNREGRQAKDITTDACHSERTYGSKWVGKEAEEARDAKAGSTVCMVPTADAPPHPAPSARSEWRLSNESFSIPISLPPPWGSNDLVGAIVIPPVVPLSVSAIVLALVAGGRVVGWWSSGVEDTSGEQRSGEEEAEPSHRASLSFFTHPHRHHTHSRKHGRRRCDKDGGKRGESFPSGTPGIEVVVVVGSGGRSDPSQPVVVVRDGPVFAASACLAPRQRLLPPMRSTTTCIAYDIRGMDNDELQDDDDAPSVSGDVLTGSAMRMDTAEGEAGSGKRRRRRVLLEAHDAHDGRHGTSEVKRGHGSRKKGDSRPEQEVSPPHRYAATRSRGVGEENGDGIHITRGGSTRVSPASSSSSISVGSPRESCILPVGWMGGIFFLVLSGASRARIFSPTSSTASSSSFSFCSSGGVVGPTER